MVGLTLVLTGRCHPDQKFPAAVEYRSHDARPANGLTRTFVSDQGLVSLSAAVNCVGTTCEEPMTEREVVLGLAAEIISAHVSNNAVQTDQLPKLIQQVFNSLSAIELKSVATSRPEPAVPIKKSVQPDRIICLDCGKQFSTLKRHLRTDHQLTPQEYRQRWDLQPAYPMVASAYAKTRSTLAKKFGLGRKGSATIKGAAAAAAAAG